MMTALTALFVALPVIGTIPAHMTKATAVAPVHYERYDYR